MLYLSSIAITPNPRGLHARHGNAADGALAALGHVVGQHQCIVHLVDVIAGQHHDVVGTVAGQDVLVLVDRVGGAAVPAFFVDALLRRHQVDELVHLALQERPAALQMAQQAVALVLRDHSDAANARIQAVRQRKVDDAELATEIHRGLGASIGQVLQPAAAPAGQDERDRALWQIEAMGQFSGRHDLSPRCCVVVGRPQRTAPAHARSPGSAFDALTASPSPTLRRRENCEFRAILNPHLHR